MPTLEKLTSFEMLPWNIDQNIYKDFNNKLTSIKILIISYLPWTGFYYCKFVIKVENTKQTLTDTKFITKNMNKIYQTICGIFKGIIFFACFFMKTGPFVTTAVICLSCISIFYSALANWQSSLTTLWLLTNLYIPPFMVGKV